MPQTAKSSGDWLGEARRVLDDPWGELRAGIDRVGDELRRGRSELEGRLEEFGPYKRARADIEQRFERGRSHVLEALGLVRRSDLERLDRKVQAISKKLEALARSNEAA